MIKSALRYSPITAGVMIAVCVAVSGIVYVTLMSHAGAVSPNGNHQRLVTIHDRGSEKVILTNAGSVKQALEEARVTLDTKDAVEPGLNEDLIDNSYYINIYRARPVIVVDGAVREKIMTPYQTPDKIAADAGMQLHDEDKTTVKPTQDIVSGGAGVELTIDRATPFTLVLYGQKTDAYTQAKTVGDMVKSKKINLGPNDQLSVSANTPITPGMTVELWRNGKQTVTEEQAIPFQVDKVQDSAREIGYHEVQTPGVNGKRSVTYEINMQNGHEISRTEIQNVVIEEAKKQVEIVGTKYSLPPGSHTDWMAAAGISPEDYGYVEYIVTREGGWCPVRWQGDAGCVNHGAAPASGGYGLVQATPGSKMASAGADWLTNPITQLRWATGYAVGRYGSWGGAYNHWVSHHNW